jgi:hypothetical protein
MMPHLERAIFLAMALLSEEKKIRSVFSWIKAFVNANCGLKKLREIDKTPN